jgi:hypothetical protein
MGLPNVNRYANLYCSMNGNLQATSITSTVRIGYSSNFRKSKSTNPGNLGLQDDEQVTNVHEILIEKNMIDYIRFTFPCMGGVRCSSAFFVNSITCVNVH